MLEAEADAPDRLTVLREHVGLGSGLLRVLTTTTSTLLPCRMLQKSFRA